MKPLTHPWVCSQRGAWGDNKVDHMFCGADQVGPFPPSFALPHPPSLSLQHPPLTLFPLQHPPPHSLSLTAPPHSLSFPYSTPPLTLFPLQHPPLSFSPTSGLQCRPLAVAHPLSLFLTRLWLAVSAFGNGLLSLKSSWTHSATAASGPLFHGLCVRMGISTGMLLPGEHALGSQIMSQAKEVSDAGAGGQVGRAGGQVGWGVRLELGGR